MSYRAPVGNTCPDIDKCIKWLKDVKQEIEYARTKLGSIKDQSSGLDDRIYEFADQADDSLYQALGNIDFDGVLEELRSANSALRDWGYGLVKEIDDINNQSN